MPRLDAASVNSPLSIGPTLGANVMVYSVSAERPTSTVTIRAGQTVLFTGSNDASGCRVTLPPALYEIVQHACGFRQTFGRLAPHCAEFAGKSVLDVGGGTGLWSRVLPPTARYTCLDYDLTRLTRARSITPRLIRADAANMPFGAQAMDAALCIAVAHHLPDSGFERLLSEIARVVRKRLIFLEPLPPGKSLAGRILWRLDEGNYFRSKDTLLSALSTSFLVDQTEVFSVFHTYLLCVASPLPKHV